MYRILLYLIAGWSGFYVMAIELLGGRILAPDPRHPRLWDALAAPERAPFISYWF